MLAEFFFIKLIIAVLVIVALSIIAENVNPKTAGILSGYPIGSAITLFFFGLENGTIFASDSAIYNMLGLVASQSFIYFYYKSSVFFKKFKIILSSIISIVGYFIVVYILHFIEPNKFVMILIPSLSILLFIHLFKEIKDSAIENKVNLSYKILVVRSLFAASTILIVTEFAKLIGSTWSGLFSAFPSTLFPLILIVHFTYGTKPVHTIIKNVPFGIGSVVLYSSTVSIVYPLFGIYFGTVMAFGVATIYFVMYNFFNSKFNFEKKFNA